jgi:succinate dehydrogenase / fumarate reductase membrane anchor subunit
LRTILLEIRQGKTYERMINYGSIAAMAILIAYGSRTILMAGMGIS